MIDFNQIKKILCQIKSEVMHKNKKMKKQLFLGGNFQFNIQNMKLINIRYVQINNLV